MRKALLTIIALAASLAASAQVNTAGLTSEAPGSKEAVYIVSYNGYYLTSKGSEIITTAIAPNEPEWVITATEGGYTIKNGSRYLTWAEGGAGVVLGDTQTWTVTADNTEADGHYTIAADIAVDFYGTIMEDYDALTVMNDSRLIPWPASWSMSIEEDDMTRDFLFFATLPAQIDNRDLNPGGGDDKDDEIVDVPENTIEGDFLANWELGLQDAKVLTYVPMKSDKVNIYDWMPQRRGNTKRESTIFTEDVVRQFQGNRIKNIYFIMPPNARKFTVFVRNAEDKDIYGGFLFRQEFDYTDAVNFMLADKTKGTYQDAYGTSLNTALLEGTDLEYYTRDVLRAFPCDIEITDDLRNIEIGYFITYPGDYKENYKNGKDAKGGLYDGIWYCTNAMLPTTRSQYALIQGSDDPDLNRPMDDYTDYQSILKDEYKWCKYAGLFCFAETEGEGGFPHTDLRFDEVKVTRCYTSDKKVPFNATFTNYGVDPIITANIDVTVAGVTRTLRYSDGIGFLEQATIDEDIVPPTTPMRTDMKINISKINGREVNIPSAIDGSIIAVDEDEDLSRMAVIEENTGTWCGWCPRGLVGMEKLREKYGENVALIGIHTGQDARTNGMMDEVLATFGATGAPTCLVNRLYLTDPYYGTSQTKFGIDRDAQKVADLITEATVNIKGVALNNDKTQLAVISGTTFNIDSETSPYRLTYVITEDGQSYQQMSYYITQTSAAEKEEYRKSDPDIYELTQKTQPWKPVINDIMEYCSEPMGIDGSIPAPIVKGQCVEHKHIITLPTTTTGAPYINNLDNCRLIVLLIDSESQEIVNAAQTTIAGSLVTDGDLFEGLDSVLAPVTDSINNSAPLYDLQGRPLTSALRHGIYLQGGRKMTK